MKAIAAFPSKREITIVDHPEPSLEAPSQVKLRMLDVGVCGTDKEIARFDYGTPPAGSDYLVMGHESLGEVVEVGSDVSGLAPGDLVVTTVRRPCHHESCVACRENRQDFCYTGDFTERGINQQHGFMTELVVDDARYMNKLPRELRDVGVLVEPLTIAEKALIQVWDVQERLPWACRRAHEDPSTPGLRALVLGAGPVGLLGAMALTHAGFQTYVYSREAADGARASLVRSFGGNYISAMDSGTDDLPNVVGEIDLVYEAVGASQLAFQVLRSLGHNAVFVFTGVPGRKGPIEVDTDAMMRDLVLKNQIVFGTVNAGNDAFAAAIRDLTTFQEKLARGRELADHRPLPDGEARRAARWPGRRHQERHRDRLSTMDDPMGAEERRLLEAAERERDWKRWGPYLSERQWGTVREDYSAGGGCWSYFPHDHARSRAYRWGEDGLLGFCDRKARVCFALALWNGQDPILKERLFGLTGPEGNHGEDVKELYYYLDATPTASYARALYKYPQRAFPYADLVEENRHRGRLDREYEILDTGVFDDGRYFDVFAEYAKAGPEEIAIRIRVVNHGDQEAELHVLPTLWLRNTWAWGREGESYWPRGELSAEGERAIVGHHPGIGALRLTLDESRDGTLLFTENETNTARLYGSPPMAAHAKDGFHEYVVSGNSDAVNPARTGTKAAAHYVLRVPPGGEEVIRLRLHAGDAPESGESIDHIFTARKEEADAFYGRRLPRALSDDEREVARQAYAGLFWSVQFYHYIVEHWLEGDPAQPPPPPERWGGRNREWMHIYNRDLVSMPDKWEYPWYAAWDLAFHTVAFARVDPDFARDQLVLMLREWYMHPNGQAPAYEFAFSDVNPPVHAWAALRIYEATGKKDRVFLARVFQKLLLNFTWWVNRKDEDGNNLFSGGFLGLDNIGVFDRSQALPTGGYLEQADGTAWMAFYSLTLMEIALELAQDDPAYGDMASKFFLHFVHIVDAMNSAGDGGLWNEEDGFYYDVLHTGGGNVVPLSIRSMVGIIPLFAVASLDDEAVQRHPGFRRRLQWFMENRKDLASHIAYLSTDGRHGHRLLAVPSRERLVRILRHILSEDELLSPHGLRSLSAYHRDHPFEFRVGSAEYGVTYQPGESETGLFGGNSNWRGPVWFPLNFLLIEALERYHHFYGDTLKVECPTGSGHMMNLAEVAEELSRRLASLFVPGKDGARPCHGGDQRYADDPAFSDLVLFNEYFHGDTGRGLGASHQTGWTALVAPCIERLARRRERER